MNIQTADTLWPRATYRHFDGILGFFHCHAATFGVRVHIWGQMLEIVQAFGTNAFLMVKA